MTIRQHGGIFGRNPKFNNVTVDGTLSVDSVSEKTAAAGVTLDGVLLKDGNVILSDGKGIDFSATSGSGTSELFDDYEEGTWTPVVADAATGGNVATAAASTGQYTKVGNVVVVDCQIIDINTSGLTAGNTLHVQGLPFTAKTNSFALTFIGGSFSSINSTDGVVFGAVASATAAVQMRQGLTNGGNVLTVAAVVSGSGDIRLSGSYIAA